VDKNRDAFLQKAAAQEPMIPIKHFKYQVGDCNFISEVTNRFILAVIVGLVVHHHIRFWR
jgi:hypothetical protein